jgi:anthranilate synthase component 1
MEFLPDVYSFSQQYDANQAQLLWARIPGDLETPVSASLKLLSDTQYGFLLESVLGGERRGRLLYDWSGAGPPVEVRKWQG